MCSTFMGLETSKRGLFTQQSALYTTGHNISNANTLGYSRQRVNMQATAGFPGTGLSAGTMPGFLGTGVEAGSIERIRDSFIDQQYRQEANKLGYWESRSQAISQMEDVLTEPSEHGLAQSLTDFWQSLQDLSNNPENGGARAVAIQRGMAVADSFNYIHKSLSDIKTNLGTEIDVAAVDINSILEQISNLNRQIAEVEPNGYLPNDLYDARDVLLDELATYIPIETSYENSGGRALAIAEGTVTVSLKVNGETVELVKGNDFNKIEVNKAEVTGADGTVSETGPVKSIKVEGHDPDIDIGKLSDVGKLKSLVKSYGYVRADGGEEGLYPDMLQQIDDMARAFALKFNEMHQQGTDRKGAQGEAFFVTDDNSDAVTAGNISVSEALVEDPNKLAVSASDEAEDGNGKNAKNLADVLYKPLTGLEEDLKDMEGMTLETYFQGIIGQLGVAGEQANRLQFNTGTLLGAVEHRRASVSSVSLDEEMTNMIKFQHAYNASARMITVVDETLDKIINGMGRVGM